MTYKQKRAASLRRIKREIAEKGVAKFQTERLADYERIRREAAAARKQP